NSKPASDRLAGLFATSCEVTVLYRSHIPPSHVRVILLMGPTDRDRVAPGGDSHEPTYRNGGRSGAGRGGIRRRDRDNGVSRRLGSRSGRRRQCPGALAIPWAVLVSGPVRVSVPALRVVPHPGSGAWAFLARLVCWWPWFVEKRRSARVRGVASPGPPVPASGRLRRLSVRCAEERAARSRASARGARWPGRSRASRGPRRTNGPRSTCPAPSSPLRTLRRSAEACACRYGPG